MLKRACLSFALLVAMPVWSQVATSAAQATPGPDDDAQMQTPPPVSGQAYPTLVGSETRSNYLDAGLILNTAYDDNVPGVTSAHPVSDVIYTIWPTIALDQTTSRQHRTLTYSPGFTFYQPTSALNDVDQSVALQYQYRLSPHATIV